MGGLFYSDYRADPERQGSEGPPPTAWETVTAAWRTNEDDQELLEQAPRNADAYRDALRTLKTMGANTSEAGPLYMDAQAGIGKTFRVFNRDAIHAEMMRMQRANPKAFASIPKTRAEFDQQIATRFGERARDQSIVERGPWWANFAGGMASSMTDPTNQASMLLGGTHSTIARAILSEALVGGATEIAMLPDARRARERMGEQLTTEEAAMRVATGAVASGALAVAGKAVATPVKSMQEAAWARIVPYLPERFRPAMSIDAVPDGVLAEAVDKALAQQDVTPDVRGAINQLHAKAALDAANPFVADPAGVAAHDRAMQDALTALLAEPGARAQPAPRGRTAPAPSTALGSGTVPQSMGRTQLKAVIGRAENASGSNTARPIDPQTGRALSSALGRYQFTEGTWIRLYKARFGGQGMSDGQIAALRTDPALQEILMDYLIALNARMLRRIGAPETAGNLYLAHFAGEGAAARVLSADPATPISRIMSAEAIAANRHIRGIENFTAQDLINWAHRRMGEAGGAGMGGSGGDDAALLAMRRMEADRAMTDARAVLGQTQAPLIEPTARGADLPEEPLAVAVHDGADIPIPVRPAAAPQARPEVDALVPRIQALVQAASRPSLNPAKLAERLGAAEADVRSALMRVKGVSTFTAKDGSLTFRRTPQSSGPEDLLTFVARRGGVRDDEGHDLKTVFEQVFDRLFTRTVTVAKGTDGKAIKGKVARKVKIRQTAFIPGAGPLIRKTGMALDRMREAVAEAGYFAGRFGRNEDAIALSTTADLIDLMTEAWAGKRKIYPNGEAPYKAPADLHWMDEAALSRIDTAAERWGLDLTEEDRALAMQLYDGEGDQALLDMIDRRLSDAVMDAYAESADDAYAFPNWIEDPANGAGRGTQGGDGPQPDAGDPGPGSAGRSYGGPDEPPEGWGPIDPEPLASFDAPDGTGMVRQADSLSHDLRADVAQKPPGSDGGLFDSQAVQEGMDFRMDDEGDVINPADLLAMLDEEEAAIRTMKDCMK